MKIRTNHISPKIFRLHVKGSPFRFVIDRCFSKVLTVYDWRFVGKTKTARATITRGKPRVFLHQRVVKLGGKRWAEVFFENGNTFDCRLGNLAPYRRDEEGARRRTFKNKRIKFRGVSIKKGAKKKKYQAVIMVKKKLIHLGYYRTAEEAAEVYRKAWQSSHPNLTLNF